MSTFEEERQRDFAAYERMKDEIVAKYRGQYVAIADGRLIKVAPTIEAAREAVKQFKHYLLFEAGTEPPRSIVYIRCLIL